VADDALRFTEIEHKFIVDAQFDLNAFRDALVGLHPTRINSIRVRDRYYLTEGGRRRRFVIRHRYDLEMHHLTLKTVEADTEVRSEINLDLGHHAGDQAAVVDAFLERLGVEWSGRSTRIWMCGVFRTSKLSTTWRLPTSDRFDVSSSRRLANHRWRTRCRPSSDTSAPPASMTENGHDCHCLRFCFRRSHSYWLTGPPSVPQDIGLNRGRI
jgi:hypothetical protein